MPALGARREELLLACKLPHFFARSLRRLGLDMPSQDQSGGSEARRVEAEWRLLARLPQSSAVFHGFCDLLTWKRLQNHHWDKSKDLGHFRTFNGEWSRIYCQFSCDVEKSTESLSLIGLCAKMEEPRTRQIVPVKENQRLESVARNCLHPTGRKASELSGVLPWKEWLG